jgi:hypothetical protein
MASPIRSTSLLDAAVGVCEWCERHPDRACPACAARRRRAVRLVVNAGVPIRDAARQMRQPVARVERLLEEEADRRALTAFAGDHVDNARLRQLLVDRQRCDPTLTAAELARRLGSSQAQVERWLGLRPTAPKTNRGGRAYPGRTLNRISVDTAGLLARAMGYAPCEIEGC